MPKVRVRAIEVGYTWVRFAGEEILTQVMFNGEGTPPILGAIALDPLLALSQAVQSGYDEQSTKNS